MTDLARLLDGIELGCHTCGGRWVVRDETVVILFHRCRPPRQRVDWRPPRQRVDDERRDWARTLLGTALEESIVAQDPEALLRKDDDE